MRSNIEVRCLRSVEEIESVRGVWTSWQIHPNSDLDFYLMVLKAKPGVVRPHVLVVLREGIPDALLIGRIDQERMELSLGYAKLPVVPVRRLTLIQNGFLGNTSVENSEALVREVLRSLGAHEADLATLKYYRTDCPLLGAVRRIPSFWPRDPVLQAQPHWAMTLPSSVEEFYRRFTSKERNTLKRRTKKLFSDFPGQVRIASFRHTVELDRMFQDIEKVAQKTYQRGLGVGFKDSPEMWDRMRLEAEKGWLQAHILYVADQPCAFWVGTLYQGWFHGNFLGYDPAYAQYSPGMYLSLSVIERFCERANRNRVTGIDFGLGDAQYKDLLCDREWADASLSIFAPTFRGLTLKALRTFTMAADHVAKRLLDRAGLFDAVKKKWRRRLSPA